MLSTIRQRKDILIDSHSIVETFPNSTGSASSSSTQSFILTLFSSLSQRSNADDPALIRWVFYQVGESDITVAIRGHNCTKVNKSIVSESDCETVLVDDFRHERTTLVTNLDQWYLTVAVLRCFCQGFMYLRILALWIGCYKARSSELKMAPVSYRQKIICAWATLFRIPGQVIVYSC